MRCETTEQDLQCVAFTPSSQLHWKHKRVGSWKVKENVGGGSYRCAVNLILSTRKRGWENLAPHLRPGVSSFNGITQGNACFLDVVEMATDSHTGEL